jgi:polysaccharide export outer membrane protein
MIRPTSVSISLVLSLSVVLLAGCESERVSTPNAEGDNGVFHRATQHVVSSAEYRIDPPDEIVVKAPNVKELDGQKQKVRPDGKVSLNLLGEVYVAGLTPTEVNDLLQKLTKQYYTNADVKVEVIANSKFYYVFGQGVAGQGRFPYTGRDTVVTALANAGFDNKAWPQQVRLSRPGKNGQDNATAVVDFTKIWGYGDLSQNYLLEEGDIIQIPYSPLWKWNERTTQVLGPITGTAGAAGTTAAVVSPGRGGGVGGTGQ